MPLGLQKIRFRLTKVGVWQNCFTNGKEALFFLLKKKFTLAFLLYKIFCNSVKKHQCGPVLPLKATGLVLKKGYFGHQIIQTSTFFHQTSTLFTEMWVSLSSVFARQSFFVLKNKSWVSHLQTAEKHGKSSVRFWFGAAPVLLISVFENVNLKNSP